MVDAVGLRFLEAWNLTYRPERDAILSTLIAEELLYSDPHLQDHVAGRQAYLDFTAEVKQRFPEIAFSAQGGSLHNGVGLVDWTLKVSPDSPPSQGAFYFELNDHGRIRRLVGFARASPVAAPEAP